MSDSKFKNIGEPEDRVIEESSEVVKECMILIQELCKARRFGYFNFHPSEPGKLNIDRVKAEMSDCVEAFERLEIKMRELRHQYQEELLEEAFRLAEKREALCKLAQPCMKCGTKQVQLVDWIQEEKWKCRECGYTWKTNLGVCDGIQST